MYVPLHQSSPKIIASRRSSDIERTEWATDPRKTLAAMWIWPAAGRADQSRDTLDSSAPTALDSPCLDSALLCIFSLRSLRIAFSTRNFLWEVNLKKSGNFYICTYFQDLGVQGILLSCKCFTSHHRIESFMMLLTLCCHWALFFINALSLTVFSPLGKNTFNVLYVSWKKIW